VKDFFSDKDFVELMEDHIKDIIELLTKKGVYFSILVNIEKVTFSPLLPEEIYKNFKPLTYFILEGYTFETIFIENNILSFEAGFGPNNFGSIVNIPLSSIVQIFVQETPIFINIAKKIDEERLKRNIKRSKDILLSNPKNKKLAEELRKRKRK